MTKPRLTQAQHTELGASLAGTRAELHRRGTQLSNAYPQTGPEAEPMELLETACKAIRQAQWALEKLCFDEHPMTATTEDYFPQDEDDLAVVVLPRTR